MSGYRVAILGATGAVGREMLKTLIARNFPLQSLVLLASERSAGQVITHGDQSWAVQAASPDVFGEVDIVLSSAGGEISEAWAPAILASGCVMIDNTSVFRMRPDVPLVVPEVNPHALDNHQGLIANPNCSTAPLVVVLHALRQLAPIERVVVSTYQSVSGAGKEAMDELRAQTADVLAGGVPMPQHLRHPIAFNLIPAIDSFTENGYTKEELKVTNESRKILEDPTLRVTATAVRVPVLVCHSESVNIEFAHPVSVESAVETLRRAPGITIQDDPKCFEYPFPVDVAGMDDTYVGRIRADISHPHGLNLWLVSDNLRKGAALNAVQIAETMHARGLIRPCVTVS
ncbi:MAG: aspartate-semialdehyde dehydrogenase [Candidatus Sericytochromatia bacterium]|nr:aspartate-semialdehyde dehydrogenase [Candidatus Sericytochromatia bacterium]